ncbi:MAG: T9SS type B sorting domain-containing protein [Flavobacteriaceae bacterium]|nr:T9SS type B sorting domain-containing protein [Muriicola sp.]NNL38891.1 T9SS type B sorting domain-containing protein [Flavobacteriaceae bacterium]
MRIPLGLLCIFFVFILSNAAAQVADDCLNAIPICNNTPVNGGTSGYGTDDFNNAPNSGCLEPTITGFIESNSAWYRFRTGASGQLGFNIGFDTSEDWDFALYKTSSCNTLGDPIRCNFFDNGDEDAYMGVGEDPTGNTGNVQYEDWIQVAPGEDYYLLINNFSNSNSGFSIQFSGQIFVTNPNDALDCSIINNLLGAPVAACDNETVTLDATTTNALGYTWFSDTGSGYQVLAGEVSPTLSVNSSAMYRVRVSMPAPPDIISDVQVAFSIAPVTHPLADEALCVENGTFNLEVKDAEALGPQDPATHLVSYHSSFSDADNGQNPLPKLHTLNSGNETIYVRVSSLENPRCYDVSEQFNLQGVITPVLNFTNEVFICENTAGELIGELFPNAQYTYSWDSGETTPSISVTQAGNYTLTVTNTTAGLNCSASRTVSVSVSEPPVISEVLIDDLQTANTVEIVNNVPGNFEYQLDTGPFQSSPVFREVSPGMHTVTINDLNGCGTVTDNIIVVGFATFFTPNGDGSNDFWQIIGIETLREPVVQIFDRYGKLLAVMEEDYLGWDGTYNGAPVPSTDYWFKISFLDDSNQRVEARYINNHFSLRR